MHCLDYEYTAGRESRLRKMPIIFGSDRIIRASDSRYAVSVGRTVFQRAAYFAFPLRRIFRLSFAPHISPFLSTVQTVRARSSLSAPPASCN